MEVYFLLLSLSHINEVFTKKGIINITFLQSFNDVFVVISYFDLSYEINSLDSVLLHAQDP